jgi:putative hemolysin
MKVIFGTLIALILILSGCISQEDDTVFCTEEWAPVCGYVAEGNLSTAKTYSNRCYAEQDENVNYIVEGECPAPEEKCEEWGQMCTMEWDPVCGVDGETYTNLCVAQSFCVEVAYEGECNDNGTQMANPASEYCIEQGGTLEIIEDETGGEIGMCTLPNGIICEEWSLFRGECEELCEEWGQPCTMEYDPVCGVDGITYGNICAAESNCVEVAYEGECEVSEEKVFCTEEQRGAEVCIMLYAPVCGYNENDEIIETYSNSCFACANEEVIYYINGECPV